MVVVLFSFYFEDGQKYGSLNEYKIVFSLKKMEYITLFIKTRIDLQR